MRFSSAAPRLRDGRKGCCATHTVSYRIHGALYARGRGGTATEAVGRGDLGALARARRVRFGFDGESSVGDASHIAASPSKLRAASISGESGRN